MIAGSQTLTRIDKMKDPYWPKTMTEDERARAVDQFLADSVVKRAFAMLDREGEELKLLHESDWLVWKSAPNPTATAVQNGMKKIYDRANGQDGAAGDY